MYKQSAKNKAKEILTNDYIKMRRQAGRDVPSLDLSMNELQIAIVDDMKTKDPTGYREYRVAYYEVFTSDYVKQYSDDE